MEERVPYADQAAEPFAGILRQALAIDAAQQWMSIAQIADRLAEQLL
jgi:hypothetical protein